MLKKVLVPLDGSANAEKVLPWIKRYAGPEKAQVVLLRVIVPEEPAGRAGWFPPEESVDEVREYLQGMERELNYRSIPAKTVIRRGAPAVEIVRAAEKEGCGLVIMTTRGGSKIARWVFGGVTEQVMRMSSVPVLVVRSQMQMYRQGRVRRILVPLDGSPLADSVIPWAERLARFHRARLVFFHAVPWPPRANRKDYEEMFARFLDRTVKLRRSLRQKGIRTDFKVEHGDAALEVLKAARKTDLVAMASHGYGGFKRWVLGSVAEKVIHGAGLPVFITKSAPRKRLRKSAAS